MSSMKSPRRASARLSTSIDLPEPPKIANGESAVPSANIAKSTSFATLRDPASTKTSISTTTPTSSSTLTNLQAAHPSPLTNGSNNQINGHSTNHVNGHTSDKPLSRTVNGQASNGIAKEGSSSPTSTPTALVDAPLQALHSGDSSDDLTDIETLEKQLAPKAKRRAPSKKKKAPQVTVKKEENAVAGPSKLPAESKKEEASTTGENPESKPKKKRAPRPKKVHGPFLPVVDYPSRFLESKKFVGAHVSISDGAHYAPHRALRLGAKAFGLFVKSQRQWAVKPLSDESIKLFPLRCGGKTESIPNEDGNSTLVQLGDGVGFDLRKHIVPHGSYLTNLCHHGTEQRQKSYENFLTELKMAEELGIGLFNIHPGSTIGGDRQQSYGFLADCINQAHSETKFIVVLLENMASGNNIVGGSFEDLAAVIGLVKDKSRIGVCFDTCHAFAAGYDLRSEETFNATWKQFDEIIGLQYLKALHINDSVKGLGSRRDLHENIGAGELGLSAFHLLMRDTRFDDLPFILETPMIEGSLNVDAKPNAQNNGATNGVAVKTEEDAAEEQAEDHEHDNDGDVEDNATGQVGLSLGASTWKREIELLHELEKVPFGQANDKIDQLTKEILAIVMEKRRKEDERKQAADNARQAAKDAKKAALIAEGGMAFAEADELKPAAKRQRKSQKAEVKEQSPVPEMEIDSEEVDQLASDYEEPPKKG